MKNEVLASNIKDVRLSKGLTQEKFGELLGIKKQAVLNWEKGNNLPSAEHLKEISLMASLNVFDLMNIEKALNKNNPLEKASDEEIKNEYEKRFSKKNKIEFYV